MPRRRARARPAALLAAVTVTAAALAQAHAGAADIGQGLDAEGVAHLARDGATIDAWRDFYERVPHATAHNFRLPTANAAALGAAGVQLCVPQKNGNRNFGMLAHALVHGRPPRSHTAVLEDVRNKTFDQQERWRRRSDDVVLFVARNPYARMLSHYLHHITANGCVSGSMECGIAAKKYKKGLSFDGFIEGVYAQRKRFVGACGQNRHLCMQVSGCLFGKEDLVSGERVRVLKVERQGEWWEPLMEALGVDRSLLFDERWVKVAGQPCYYAPNGDCQAAAARRGGEGTRHGLVIGPIHGTNATARVMEYYTPQAAARVTELMAHDFELLGYPEWDGVSEFQPL